MDSSDVPATVPSGATTLGGVQVLPIRLPTLPPTLEAALLGITHSLVAAPVLYAVATPAFEVMSRYWIYLIQRGAFLLSNPFVSMPRWGFWRYTGGLGYSTVRLLLLTVLAAAAVHVLTLPLQVGARRRARTDRRTVPVYAAAGGLGLALVTWWVGLAPLILYRAHHELPLLALIALMAAGRVALAGRRARLDAREFHEIVRELGVGAATLAGGLAACSVGIAGGTILSRTFGWVGLAMAGIPPLAAFVLLVLRPTRDLILSAGSPTPAAKALPGAAPKEGAFATDF